MFTVRHSAPGYTGRVIIAGADLDFIDGAAKVAALSPAQQTVITAVKRWGVSQSPPRIPKLPNSKTITEVHAK